MGALFSATWSMVAAAGVALAFSAPLGADVQDGKYLAGHVLLGLGLGQLITMLLRIAGRRIRKALLSRPAPSRSAQVTVLPVRRPATRVTLRGKHAG